MALAFALLLGLLGTQAGGIAEAATKRVTTARTAAPTLSVDGQTLRWNQVADVTKYVLATIAPGQATTYRQVAGTSHTPAAVAGTTIRYGLASDVPGAQWAVERSITYPSSAPPPPPTPAPTPSPAPSGLYSTGVNSGSWGDHTSPANDMASLNAKHVRVGVSIGTRTATIDAHVEKYRAKGVTVMLLAEFPGRVPTSAEARNVASWAARYGANGSFWAGRANPKPIRWIEFGNETAYTYQFSSNSTATYAQRAKDFALRFKEARQAMTAIGSAGSSVGLLAQADPNRAWLDNMFAAVPDLASYAAGWTMHPYGPAATFKTKMDDAMANLAAKGAAPSAAKPMFITEYGIASDNGRTLDNNFGWPTNLTYAQTAANYLSIEGTMRRYYGEKIRLFILYTGRDLSEPGATNQREQYFGCVLRNNWSVNSADKGQISTAVRTIMSHGV